MLAFYYGMRRPALHRIKNISPKSGGKEKNYPCIAAAVLIVQVVCKPEGEPSVHLPGTKHQNNSPKKGGKRFRSEHTDHEVGGGSFG